MVATVFGLFHPFYHSSGKMLCAKLIRNIESSKRITIMRIWVGNVFNCYENNHFLSLYCLICPFSAEMETIQRNFGKLWALWEGEEEDMGRRGSFSLVEESVTVRRSETDGEISGAGGKM